MKLDTFKFWKIMANAVVFILFFIFPNFSLASPISTKCKRVPI